MLVAALRAHQQHCNREGSVVMALLLGQAAAEISRLRTEPAALAPTTDDTDALRKRVDGWRGWARFVFTYLTAEETAAMTDNELQHAAAAGCDDHGPSPRAQDLK